MQARDDAEDPVGAETYPRAHRSVDVLGGERTAPHDGFATFWNW